MGATGDTTNKPTISSPPPPQQGWHCTPHNVASTSTASLGSRDQILTFASKVEDFFLPHLATIVLRAGEREREREEIVWGIAAVVRPQPLPARLATLAIVSFASPYARPLLLATEI